jgi:hypothetical protein
VRFSGPAETDARKRSSLRRAHVRWLAANPASNHDGTNPTDEARRFARCSTGQGYGALLVIGLRGFSTPPAGAGGRVFDWPRHSTVGKFSATSEIVPGGFVRQASSCERTSNDLLNQHSPESEASQEQVHDPVRLSVDRSRIHPGVSAQPKFGRPASATRTSRARWAALVVSTSGGRHERLSDDVSHRHSNRQSLVARK